MSTTFVIYKIPKTRDGRKTLLCCYGGYELKDELQKRLWSWKGKKKRWERIPLPDMVQRELNWIWRQGYAPEHGGRVPS